MFEMAQCETRKEMGDGPSHNATQVATMQFTSMYVVETRGSSGGLQCSRAVRLIG